MVDWRARQGIRSRHKHFAEDIIDPTTAAPAVLGGAQTTRLLGPFHIAHDTPGMSGTIAIGDVPAGAVVLEIFIVHTESWAASESFEINVGLSDPADLPNWDWLFQDTMPMNVILAAPGNKIGVRGNESAAVFTTTDKKLVVDTNGDNAPTAGEADIYALIAEPAA